MMQQFCRGTALSTYNSNITQLYRNRKTSDVAAAQKLVDDDPGADAGVTANLAVGLVTAQAKTQGECLIDAGD